MEIPITTLKEILCCGTLDSHAKGSPSTATPKGETNIVVLDRGWVFVGKTHIDGDFYVIENARSIRAWGTTKGLGELRDGPTSATKLDDSCTVKAPAKSVIFLIKCTRDW